MEAEGSAADTKADGFSLANILNGHDENLEHPDVRDGEDDESVEAGQAASGYCIECEGELLFW